jgi:hypothetical protein
VMRRTFLLGLFGLRPFLRFLLLSQEGTVPHTVLLAVGGLGEVELVGFESADGLEATLTRPLLIFVSENIHFARVRLTDIEL